MDEARPLNIVHFSTYANLGGAGKAAYRVHRGLCERGHHSILYSSKIDSKLNDQSVKQVWPYWFSPLMRKWRGFHEKKIKEGYAEKSFHNFSFNLKGEFKIGDKLKNADAVMLYGIGDGFLAIDELAKINKPIIWRLSDAWAISGGCHYPWGCEKLFQSCGQCPLLNSSNSDDPTHLAFEAKRKAYSKLKIVFVSQSNWLAELARKSPLTIGHEVKVIPNGIDTNRFTPQDKSLAKARFNLPADKIILGVGAHNGDKDPRKGLDLVKRYWEQLGEKKSQYHLLFFGDPPVEENDLKFLYSAMDIFICPSREENMANTALEAMSCGTPVVAFNIGGMPDFITPQTGAVVPPFDLEQLEMAIEIILNNNDFGLFKENCRKHILEKFSIELQVERYQNLLRELSEYNG